jgi:glycerol-3-phosphate dehydrogenase
MASMPNKKVIYDVAVVGGGVVGCGVARALTLGGFRVVLLEKEDALASGWASAGNTGQCRRSDPIQHDVKLL